MNGILIDIGTALLSNGWQIVAGSIIAIPLYFLPVEQWEGQAFLKKLGIIILMAAGGMILPLNIFGIIPVVVVLVARGWMFSLVLPLLVSNMLFNMLVPINDPGFVWRTGIPRVVFAWVAGIAAGVLFVTRKSNSVGLFNGGLLTTFVGQSFDIKKIIVTSGKNLLILTAFLISGALINSVFHRIVWVNFLQLLYTSPQTSFLPRLFAGLNVTHPAFLLAMTGIMTITDLARLTGLFAVLKPKGVLFYIIYSLVWVVLLTVPVLIR